MSRKHSILLASAFLALFANKSQGVPAMNEKTQLASTFEPKVAEAVFDEIAKEAGFRIVKGRLDLAKGVVKDGKRISALRLEEGTILRGKMFIDASYEGDLLVPWALSFTHIAFGSIRMEPVFMLLSQSAATAASMAIDDGTSVQKRPYAKLRECLLADGQALE